MKPVCVRLNKNGAVLARATEPEQIIRLEGNWYFDPKVVHKELLRTTDRLYTCPYKGTCNWIDFEDGALFIPDVAWVYPETFPDYKSIAGWYGFYPSTSYYVTRECEN